MTTLYKRVSMIEALGAKVTYEDHYVGEGKERHRETIWDKVRYVHLPLSAEEWAQLAMREGPFYVGGCCSNMSLLQDIVNGAFRDGGGIDGPDLLQMGELARGHDGFEYFEPMDDERFFTVYMLWKGVQEDGLPEGQIADVWAKLGLVYNAVEPGLTPRSYERPGDAGHWDPLRHRFHVASNEIAAMDWFDLFSPSDDPDEVAQHEANRRVKQARLLPQLREIVALIEAEGVDFEGFAIIKPDGEVLSDNRGLCLYPDRAHAERVMELWARWAKEEQERQDKWKAEGRELTTRDTFWQDRKAEIVPATVTVVDGLRIHRTEGDT